VPEPGVKGRQESELKARIADAGLAAFADNGYDKTTVDDVIHIAGTSRATFYRYFDNKQALFRELSGECFREFRRLADRLAEAPPGEDPRARLRLFLDDYDAVHTRYSGVIRAWTENRVPDDAKLREEADRAFVRLVDAFTGPIEAAGTDSEVPAELRAALLYIVVERIHFYAHSRYAGFEMSRLHDTLGVIIQRAFFGGGAPSGSRLRIGGRVNV
jgi:AcrR family transcriptional regulator